MLLSRHQSKRLIGTKPALIQPKRSEFEVRTCQSRSAREWEQELADIGRDTALHVTASHDCAAKGSKILEFAQPQPAQFVTQNPAEQARR
jgi:hypothetical protein